MAFPLSGHVQTLFIELHILVVQALYKFMKRENKNYNLLFTNTKK